MSEMAEKLGVSPSYVSAVEFGRRPVPNGWVEKIARALSLSTQEAESLSEAATLSSSRSKGEVTLSLEYLTPFQEEVAIQFARRINKLSDEELHRIRDQLLEDRTGEQNWYRGHPKNAG